MPALSCLKQTLIFHGVCQRGREVGQHQTDERISHTLLFTLFMTPKSRELKRIKLNSWYWALSVISSPLLSVRVKYKSVIWIIECFAIQSSRSSRMLKIIAGTFNRPEAYVRFLNWSGPHIFHYLAYFPVMHALKVPTVINTNWTCLQRQEEEHIRKLQLFIWPKRGTFGLVKTTR